MDNKEALTFLADVMSRLNSTNSSKMKLDILTSVYDTTGPEEQEWLNWALVQTYSPYVTFGVTSESIKKWMKNFELPDMFAEIIPIDILLQKLDSRELTGNRALQVISDNLMYLPKECREVVYNIIDKNLKIRMDAKSINKVIHNLIPVFEVSLCNVYADRKHKVNFEKDKWFASRKLDGCVSGDTLISVKGGKSLPIKTIVENKMDIKVLTYNTETNKTEYKPIKNHMKNMDDINEQSHQWFELELEDGRKLKVTGNHKIYLPELQCWRRVDDLTENDKLLVI